MEGNGRKGPKGTGRKDWVEKEVMGEEMREGRMKWWERSSIRGDGVHWGEEVGVAIYDTIRKEVRVAIYDTI